MAKTLKEQTTKQILDGPRLEVAKSLCIARKAGSIAQEHGKRAFDGAGKSLIDLLGFGVFEVPGVAEVDIKHTAPEAKPTLNMEAFMAAALAAGVKPADFLVKGPTPTAYDSVRVTMAGGVQVQVTILEPVLATVAAIEAP